MIHLDPASLDRVLDGTISPELAAKVATHLHDECEVCSEVIEQADLTLATLDRLWVASSASQVAMDPALAKATFDHVLRELPAQPSMRRGRVDALRRLGAAVLLAATALFLLQVPDQDGAFGPDSDRVGITLQIAAGSEQVVDGTTIPTGTPLTFQIDANKAAARYLFAVDADGNSQKLAPRMRTAHVKSPGPRTLTHLAYEAETPGPMRFVAAASPEPHEPGEVMGQWVDGKPHAGVTYTVLHVTVTPAAP